jgi:hypothetical protein
MPGQATDTTPDVEQRAVLLEHGRTGAGALGVGAGRSRHTTRTPGCWRSHTANVAACRSGSMSTGRWVSMPISTVPYTCPRRSAKSSTPSTATAPTAGRAACGSSAAGWSGWPPAPAGQRAGPRRGRPTPTRPRRASAPARGSYREVNPGICSAKVRFGQSAASQYSRRTPQHDRHRCPTDRGVGHPTPVAAVHPGRTRPAPGTATFLPDRRRDDHHHDGRFLRLIGHTSRLPKARG